MKRATILNAVAILWLMAVTDLDAAASDTEWKSLFNGKDFSGWDTY